MMSTHIYSDNQFRAQSQQLSTGKAHYVESFSKNDSYAPYYANFKVWMKKIIQ